jgi:hypothetical protein
MQAVGFRRCERQLPDGHAVVVDQHARRDRTERCADMLIAKAAREVLEALALLDVHASLQRKHFGSAENRPIEPASQAGGVARVGVLVCGPALASIREALLRLHLQR